MPLGFLAVLTHPSSQLTLEDFHAWYEEEHIPLRMDKLEEFLSGARYCAADHDIPHTGPSSLETSNISKLPVEKPDWLAMYEIDDTETFEKPVYTDLRKMRSARETDVMRRIEVVERRVGRVAWDSEADLGVSEMLLRSRGAGSEKGTGLRVGNPCQWIVTASLETQSRDVSLSDDDLRIWLEAFSRSNLVDTGVERIRAIDVFDWGCTSMGPAITGVVGPRWLNIAECTGEGPARKFVSEQASLSKANTSSGLALVDWRLWNLWKAYPSLAQSASSNAP
ncbi:hypothetical protein BJ165DRAFT_1482008 [Panaeolus papilionaceus]|nr:hypothetical protein BJ165DRAFT_1482008 [Panaeolus papilionaceus]